MRWLPGVRVAVSIPAFDKSRRKILRPGVDPAADDRCREKRTQLDLGQVKAKIALILALVKPDKLVAGSLGRRNLSDPFQRDLGSQLLHKLSFSGVIVVLAG